MLGIPLRYYAKHPNRALAALARHPQELWITMMETYAQHREGETPPDLYHAEADWEQRLHHLIGAPWPCGATSEFWTLWPKVIGELEAKGIHAGPTSYLWWNDGDAGLVRSIWCLIRHLRPNNVVETGVAHGVTSRFVLEALERNGAGHLWSIDLPPLIDTWHEQIGIAVEGPVANRWSYIRGASKQRLPGLISELGRIDLFIHDSMHSEHNVRFEMDRAWAALRPGGAIVVDDIDANRGFQSFTQSFSGHQSLVCEAEPLRPDLRRFNERGLFGIILKGPTATRVKN